MAARTKKPAEPVSDNVRRLRLLANAVAPVCCDQPMRQIILYFGEFTDEKLKNPDVENKFNATSESEQADDLVAKTPLCPVWSCDVCEKEQPFEGLDWPEYKPEKERTTEPEKAGATWSFCPHCGGKLDKAHP